MMRRLILFLPLAACVQLAAFAAAVRAADIQLKPEARVEKSPVVLADVAEIYAAAPEEARRLGQVELFPAPQGSRQTYSHQQIRAALKARGIQTAQHRFMGASQVVVQAAGVENPGPAKRFTPAQVRAAERLVSTAIEAYLRQHASASAPWVVKPQIADKHYEALTRAAASQVAHSSADGARQLGDWLGLHTFVLDLSTEGKGKTSAVTISAAIELPPKVVVAAEALSRGTIIRPQHLKLQLAPPDKKFLLANAFCSLDDVVGWEVLRPISAGEVIDATLLRRPILVKKGEQVAVRVLCGGVRLRDLGFAKEEGARGDLITIQSSADKKRTYQARVSGLGEVELILQTPSVRPLAEPAPGN